MTSDVRSLYQEIILDHNKNPRNFRAMEDATHVVDGYNPLCGDHYTVYLRLKDGTIEDISFTGSGCAISKASASVMTAMTKGKSAAEATALFATFHDLVTGVADPARRTEELGRLAAFAGVSEFPARVKCASLAWHTMKGALESKTSVSTE